MEDNAFSMRSTVLLVLFQVLILSGTVHAETSSNPVSAPRSFKSAGIEAGAGGGVTGAGTVLPDLFTGTMSYGIPIGVTPGRKGMQPSLSLAYRSNSNNGWVGVGWDLEIPAIERSVSRGLTYDDNTDTFILRMNGSAIELINDTAAGFYRARVEGGFFRIEKQAANGGFWKLTDKTGKSYLFGQTAAARQDDPANPGRIFKWCLDRVEDTNANYINYFYEKDLGQIYPSRIDYTGNSVTGALPMHHVYFYTEARTDAPDRYLTNFSVRTLKRLSAIEVRANNETMKVYKLRYDTGFNNRCPEYSSSTCRSLLTSVQEYGRDAVLGAQGAITNESSASRLPAMTFTYQAGGTHSMSWQNWGSGHLPTDLVGDFNGDGRTDVVQIYNGALYEWLSIGTDFNALGSQGTGHTAADRPADFTGDGMLDMFQMYQGTALVRPSTGVGFGNFAQWGTGFNGTEKFGDFNGDGRMDAVQFYNGDALVWLSNGAGPATYGNWGPGHLDTDVVVDVNGDGRADIIQVYGGSALVWRSTGTTFQTYQQWGSAFNGTEKFGDFNGDGKTDVIQFYNGDAFVWLSTGNDFTTHRLWGSGHLATDMIADMNGDGMSDVVQMYNGTALVSLSTGSGFMPFQEWGTGFNGTEQLGDFDGDGKTDIIQFYGGTAYVWLNEGPYPDLLSGINNGIGGTTTIAYSPSANVGLPFPVQTVSSITQNDGNGVSATTTYAYSDGYFHIGQRDFRGFNKVTVTGPAGPQGEQRITETWFHQGDGTTVLPEGVSQAELLSYASVTVGYMKGKPYRTKIKDAGGMVYSTTETIYQANDQAHSYYFTPVSRIDSYQCESGPAICDATSYGKHLRTEYVYDPGDIIYGNVSRELLYGDDLDPADNRTVSRIYAYNAGSWIAALPKEEIIYQGIGVNDANKVSKTEYFYDGADTCEQTSSNQVPSRGNLTRIKRWLDGVNDPSVRMAYDPYGNPACTMDANGNKTTISYDSTFTYLRSAVSPPPFNFQTVIEYYGVEGQLTDYGLYGQVKSVRDANNQTTTMVYDTLGRKTRVTAPDGSWTSWAYNNLGTIGSQNVTVDNIAGLTSWTYFDGFGRPYLRKQDGSDNKTLAVRTQYNPTGTVIQTSLPYFDGLETVRWISYKYDPLGRAQEISNPDFTTSRACYTNGVIVGIDANGHRKRQTRDALGRLVKVEEYTGAFSFCATDSGTPYATTTYQYDPLGNLRYVTDANGNQTEMRYDNLGRKNYMHDPDMGTWTYAYDANGNLKTQTDAKGQTITFSYDSMNRLILKDYPSGTDITYTYDESWSENPKGRLTTMTDASGSTKYYYDTIGRPKKITKRVDATDYTVQYAYDGLGRLQYLTYPDNDVVRYDYNTGGSLYQIVNNGTGTNYALYAGYNALGQPGNVTFGNGVNTTYTYLSNNNLLESIRTSISSTLLMHLSYGYDPGGYNITSITDTAPHTNQPLQVDEVAAYAYNTNGVQPHALRKELITNATYTYDPNGNMTADGYRTIVYNYDNMPISVTTGTYVTTFVYDGAGNRVKKTDGYGTVVYIGKLYECNASNCVKYIYAGGERIAQKVVGGTIAYYHSDHLGSNSVITNASGAKIGEMQYFPFGEHRTSNQFFPSGYQYTGQEYDAWTGLYNYNARLYNPAIGRFISADTIVPDPRNPQAFNRYSYVMNSPLNFTDPTGYWRISISAHIGIGAHLSYDFSNGHFNGGVGYGAGAGVSVGDRNWDIGASSEWYVDYGYDNKLRSDYVTAKYGSGVIGPNNQAVGGWGASGTYYLRRGEYQVGAGVGYGGVGVNVGYSSFGKGSWSVGGSILQANATYDYGNKSWHYGYTLTLEQIRGQEITQTEKIQALVTYYENEYYGSDFSNVSFYEGGLWRGIYGLFGMGGMVLGNSINLVEGTTSIKALNLQGIVGHELYHVIQFNLEGFWPVVSSYLYGYKNNTHEIEAQAASGYPR